MMAGDTSADDLAYLRQESLKTVLFCMIAGLYVWCAVLFHAGDEFGLAWLGPALLAGGLALAFASRVRNTSRAAAAAILGFAAAALYSMALADIKLAPYMLAIVVALTGLLFDLKAVAWVTVLCVGSIVAVGSLRWGHSVFSAELASPVLVTGAVGILSSLAVRNLYEALYWFQERAEAAQHNETELRDRQGQLARTVKALDEAYRRLEYLNYDLARAREEAEETRLVKQQFVTSVSHELRTPLNVVVALSEMMYLSPQRYHAGALPPALRGDVREIYRSSQHLLHLIDDVLDMSQIEAGEIKLCQQPVPLRDVVVEALDMIRPLVRETEVALKTDVPADLPPVLIDRNRVQQVLLNLLNNARRFTGRGSISVQASLEAEQVRVTVADTGIGIPPGEHDKMFKEFHQLDGPATQGEDGSGLGLAISKRFIELHGGRIWLESDGVPGQGSRFHFTLPVEGARMVEVSTLQGSRKLPGLPSGRGRTLLLLDQDATIARMLEQRLDDYQIVPVGDVAEVARLVDELHARAVVVNPARRKQNRQQVSELRRQLGDSSMPIVFCPLVSERRLGESLGVADYLTKPVTREAIMALLDRLGDGVRRILVVDDNPQMVRLLSRMLQMAEREYEILRAYDGREGLREMRSQHPDLVLLDLVMPGMDGYDVLARVQNDAELRDIPVAVITAQTRTAEEERQLGGKTLLVSSGAGFTNEEAIDYLRGILDAARVPAPLRHVRQPA
jgi:signal transduction histidine kinase/CheY-like chemotaxis protein